MPGRTARVLLAATLAASVLVPATASSSPAAPSDKHATAVGGGGAVVSDTPDATRAGIDVLRAGGTAADAAVAAAATLGVTDPYVAGIGGGGYFVYYDARTHRVSTIDGREQAPLSARADRFVDPKTGQPMDFNTAVNNGISVGVPGTLATWQRALQKWGHFPLSRVLAPAQQVAERGFTVDATFADQTRQNAARFRQFAPTARLFLPGGKVPAVGSTFRNPDLARTYQLIRTFGPLAFYLGPIGADVVRTVDNPPVAPGATIHPSSGGMSLADLGIYQPREPTPTHVNYRGYDVYGMAPSSSGGIAVGEALNILARSPLSTLDRTQALHRYLEASKLVYADRSRYVGDDRYTPVPQRQLLSPAYAASRACLIDPNHASVGTAAPGDPYHPAPCTPKPGAPSVDNGMHTNHLVVTDRWGNAVSYTHTIEQLGGSAITVPGRGFLLNNELTDFDFAPSTPGAPDPNLPAPVKRPRSSIAATFVTHGGKPFLAVGSPGGATIITTVLQILLNRIDFGMTLPQAIAAPRASERNSGPTQVEPAFLASPEAAGLRRLGHTFVVAPTPDQSNAPPTIGVAAGIEYLPDGRVLAAGEPVRRGGSAAAVVTPR